MDKRIEVWVEALIFLNFGKMFAEFVLFDNLFYDPVNTSKQY